MNLKWQKIKQTSYKSGYKKMLKKTFKLPGGQVKDYDIRDEGNQINIVAITPKNKVILVKIFRPGPEEILMEIPGGSADKNEKPLDAAKRELLEETGYSGEFELIGSVIDDAYSNCIRYTYLCKNSQKVQDPKREEDEIMEVVEMDINEFKVHIRSGRLTDTESGYLALEYLNYFK